MNPEQSGERGCGNAGEMSEQLDRASKLIRGSEALLVTASNGLSITEGLNLFAGGDYFRGLFPTYAEMGMQSIIHGIGAAYRDERLRWGFWTELIGMFELDYSPSEVMRDLLKIIGGRPSFFLTSNGEGHLTACGIPEEDILEIEGNWRTMQCSHARHGGIYGSLDVVRSMRGRAVDGAVPAELIPYCPVCGSPMRIRVQTDRSFVRDMDAERRFGDFVDRWHDRRLTVLELGIGPRNTLIKAPVMRMVGEEPEWRYISVNMGELFIPASIVERSVGIDGLLGPAMSGLVERLEG